MRSTGAASKQAPPLKSASGERISFGLVLRLLRRIAWPVLLLAIAFAVYYPSLHYSFILDDHRFTGDPRIQESGHLFEYFSNYVWAQFTGGPPSFYRPVFLLWMRLNYVLAELSPLGWHLLSIVKHLAVGILLGLLIYRLLDDRAAAFVAAALFTLHPSHTESVSWVTVPDPLLALGLLLSLLFYFRYMDGFSVDVPAPARKLRRAASGEPERSFGKWLAASATAYFAALLAKETAIVFPAVILVLALSLSGVSASDQHRPKADRTAAKRRMLAQFAVFGGVTLLYLLLRLNALDGKLAAATQHLPAGTVALSWPATLWFYAKAILWPVKSYAFADPTLIDRFSARGFLLPLAALICCALVLTAGCAWAWRTAQKLNDRDSAKIRFSVITGVLLLILPLLLALNLNALNPGDFLHGRYVYLPLAGLSILVATGIHIAHRSRVVLLGIVGAIAIAFLPLTWAQEKQWQDDSTVFTTAHQLAPNNLPVARNLMNTRVRAALLTADDGKCGEAMPVFNEALGKYPDDWYAWAGHGICLAQANDLVNAEESFHRAADLSNDPGVRQQWQALRAQMGLPTSAPTN